MVMGAIGVRSLMWNAARKWRVRRIYATIRVHIRSQNGFGFDVILSISDDCQAYGDDTLPHLYRSHHHLSDEVAPSPGDAERQGAAAAGAKWGNDVHACNFSSFSDRGRSVHRFHA